MVKRCIGIDIGFSHLCAVQVASTGKQFCIEKVFSTQTRRSTDSPLEILRALISQRGFDRRADIAISMPHNTVFFRSFETDFAGAEQIHAGSLSALEHDFPAPPDEIVAQICSQQPLPEERYSVLVAAVKRASLHERLSIFAGTKMRPDLAEPAISAVHSAAAINHPEIMTNRAIIAYIGQCYLTFAVTENNNILNVRNIPIVSCSDNNADSVQEQVAEVLSREAEITWRKVFGTETKQDTKIYFVVEEGLSTGFEATFERNLPCRTAAVDPYARVKCSTKHNGNTEICLAEGLALSVLAPDKTAGTNFLEADGSHVRPTLELKSELITFAMLVAAIGVISLIGLFLRLSHLETKYAHIKNETKQIFHAALPEEKNIVSPLAQLEQKVESLRADYRLFAPFCPTDLSPIEVLHNITVSTPSHGNVKVDELLITTASVRLRGTCDSFESVYQWQRLLQEIPGFTFVDVQDVQKESKSGTILFTILISSKMSDQK